MPKVFHKFFVKEGANKLQLVLPTLGCEWARTNGPCTNCGFPNVLKGKELASEEEVLAFLDNQLKYRNNGNSVNEVDLYCSGNFFNDNEISKNYRKNLLNLVSSTPSIQKLLVESRPEYITQESIGLTKQLLPHTNLEVGIGLETSDDNIRNISIKKGFSKSDFEQAVSILSSNQALLLAYLLIKPAFLSESSAIDDAIKSAEYVFKTGKDLKISTRVEYGVTFIQKDSPIHQLYRNEAYRPAWLWSVVEVLKNTSHLGNITIATKDSGLVPDRLILAHRANWNSDGLVCQCSDKIEELIDSYNSTKSIDYFVNNLPSCSCKNQWLKDITIK